MGSLVNCTKALAKKGQGVEGFATDRVLPPIWNSVDDSISIHVHAHTVFIVIHGDNRARLNHFDLTDEIGCGIFNQSDANITRDAKTFGPGSV